MRYLLVITWSNNKFEEIKCKTKKECLIFQSMIDHTIRYCDFVDKRNNKVIQWK